MIQGGGAVINKLISLLHQYDPDVRLIVAAIFLLCALYVLLYHPVLALLFSFLFVGLLFDVLRNSSVWSGFAAFRRGDMARVEYALSQVRWQQWLSPQSRAYHSWLKGITEVTAGRYAAAKVHLLLAINGKLRTQNDRSLLHCLLAEIALQESEDETAREHLKHARALKHYPEVERIIHSLGQRIAE